jgi:hypothetical protein
MARAEPASEDDVQRAYALIHDAHLLMFGSDKGPSEHELVMIKEELGLAEKLLGGVADDGDRTRVRDIVHPSTASNFLDGGKL